MSIVERARERVEDIRAKGAMVVLEEKFPKVKEMRGGGSYASPQLPTLKDVREKGILGVLEKSFPKVREIREKGVLARILGRARPLAGEKTTGDTGAIRGDVYKAGQSVEDTAVKPYDRREASIEV